MNCKRCGHELPSDTTVCPACGTVLPQRNTAQPATIYGISPQSGFGEPPLAQPTFQAPLMYGPAYQAPPIYTRTTSRDDSALITEVLLSLIGLFGIGWLMAGETAIGVILLVCSFLFYWPIILGGALITDGFGLICLGPLAIGIIILNAVLLNNRLRRKAGRSGPPRTI